MTRYSPPQSETRKRPHPMKPQSLTAALAVVALATPGTAAAQPTSGIETFVGLAGASGGSRVIAAGPITAVGTDEVLSPTRDIYHFPSGDLIIDHVTTSTHQSFDPTTCIFRLTRTTTLDIASGTGAYAGATGQDGSATVHIFKQGCGPKPNVFVFLLKARIRVSLPA